MVVVVVVRVQAVQVVMRVLQVVVARTVEQVLWVVQLHRFRMSLLMLEELARPKRMVVAEEALYQ